MTTREKFVDDMMRPGPGRRGGTCPECHGTGFVFVMPDQADLVPLKRQPGNWAKSRKMICGMCGGDGRIDDVDFWPTGHHTTPADWYATEKRKVAE